MRTPVGIYVALIIGAAMLLVAGLFWPGVGEDSAAHRVLAPLEEPRGGPIELPLSSTGKPFRLDDYPDDYLWVYFGYTTCPDACPVSLAWVGGALRRLPPELEGRVRALFVSVDPERDDLERLSEYAAFFHPAIIAATGPHEMLLEIARRYGVVYRRAESRSALGYVVDHSSVTYLVGPGGRLLESHPHGVSSSTLLDALARHAGISAVAGP